MNPANADLHCHSTVSDGTLPPAAIVARARDNGVDLLALTDHDEIGGLSEARQAAAACGMHFINGVEISVSWGDDLTLHIVGLAFDERHPALIEGLARVRSGRDQRAQRMADELAKAGIHGAYQGALKYVGNPALVSRSHFARYIVELGLARDVKTVFEHWLAKGKPGYVAHPWASLEEAIGWITAAGGVAILAHPGRYRLSRAGLREVLGVFRELGGAGLEVVSGTPTADEVADYARLAREFGLHASRGSDFHGPGESHADLGRLPNLPDDVPAIWQRFGLEHR